MIVYLSRDVAELAIRIRETNTKSVVSSWQQLALHIIPGQWDNPECWEGGSPWYLYGCWPGFHTTGVDVANPWRRDFPTIRIPAHTRDAEGRIVFRLTGILDRLPNGRFGGAVVAEPAKASDVWNPCSLMEDETPVDSAVLTIGPDPEKVILPAGYNIGKDCNIDFSKSEPPMIHKASPCVLYRFDIDIGPECYDHGTDEITIELRNSCMGEDYGCA